MELRYLLLSAALCVVLHFISKMVVARRKVLKLKRAGLAMPDFSPLTGHLHVLQQYMAQLPPDCTTNTPLLNIGESFHNGGLWYFDLWPFSKPVLIVTSASAAFQLQRHALNKMNFLVEGFQKLTGGPNLFTMTDPLWKHWRGIFNPAFSHSYMLDLTPAIAREVKVFCDILRDRAAESNIFQFEDLTLKLTLDVIGAVALDTRLHHQTKDHPLATSLRTLIEWIAMGSEMNPLKRFNFLRPLVHWFSGRRMDRFIHAEINKRFFEILNSPKAEESKRSKSIISLVLKDYLATMNEKELENPRTAKIDKNFLELATAQLRLFLFAGHDTTSATLIYCYHMLSECPDALAKVRAEHEEVFGPSSQVYETICQNPSTLDKLPYTSAVIKETMRLFPAASASRDGVPGVSLTDDEGQSYPTEGCIVWVLHLALHRTARYWKDPDAFIPERWLVSPEHPLHPTKGAWRPFEFGPHNCIGQDLATIEIRTVLAMTIRDFKISPAYDEWDAAHPKRQIKTVFGNRAYQIEGGAGGAHPSERYPCRVSLI